MGRGRQRQLVGGDGDDRLEGASGNDTLDGGTGQNTAVYSDARSNYSVTRSAHGTIIVAGPDGTDYVRNVQSFIFAGQTYAANDLVNTPASPGEGGGS